MLYFQFAVALLAVWRITHLLSKEDAPFDLIFNLRKKIGQGFFATLLDCFYCLSIWTAIPFAAWIASNFVEGIIYSLALSGAACVIEKLTNKQNKPPQYFED